jgi:hypothetical protein
MAIVIDTGGFLQIDISKIPFVYCYVAAQIEQLEAIKSQYSSAILSLVIQYRTTLKMHFFRDCYEVSYRHPMEILGGEHSCMAGDYIVAYKVRRCRR